MDAQAVESIIFAVMLYFVIHELRDINRTLERIEKKK